MNPPFPASVSKRRWFRFSLRSFLLLTALVAVMLAYHVRRVQKQEAAISSLEAIGGRLSYDAQNPSWVWLRSIVGEKYFRTVVGVNLGRTEATDAHAACLACFPHITHLVLSHTQITDKGMQHLRGLNKLVWLELEYMPIGDEGIVHCKSMDKLSSLRCSGTNISSVGIAKIADLAKTLNELWLQSTKVNHEQVKNIKAQWPNTTIVYGSGRTL